MVGYHDLKGCVEKRPTRESPLDCNGPPEQNKNTMRWPQTLIVLNLVVSFFLFLFFNLVWFCCDLLFKPLEHFVVFSLMHSHLLQVCRSQG